MAGTNVLVATPTKKICCPYQISGFSAKLRLKKMSAWIKFNSVPFISYLHPHFSRVQRKSHEIRNAGRSSGRQQFNSEGHIILNFRLHLAFFMLFTQFPNNNTILESADRLYTVPQKEMCVRFFIYECYVHYLQVLCKDKTASDFHEEFKN